MRRFLWTGLLVVLVLALGAAAAASPGVTARGASIALKLDASSAMEEPLSRWLNQMADLTHVTVRAAKWDDTQSVSVTLTMGEFKAFGLNLLREEGVTTLTSSLLDAPCELPLMCDWADALFSCAEALYKMPSKGRAIPLSGEGLARAMNASSVKLRAWASTARAMATEACEGCGECAACRRCEATDALAIIIDAIAMDFDEVVDKNVLVVSIDPFDVVEQPPAAKTATQAPGDINVRLIKDGMWAVAVAIAANEPGTV